jgi:hypothetical protein
MHWEIAERGVDQPIEASMAALPERYGLFRKTRTKPSKHKTTGRRILKLKQQGSGMALHTRSEWSVSAVQTRASDSTRQPDVQSLARTRRTSGASATRRCASGSADHIH